MNPPELRLALQLRQAAVVGAQLHLADCIGVEMQAAATAWQADAAIQHEAEAASAVTSDDARVEAFAAWLPHGRSAQAIAGARHAACLDATSVARAGLGVARAAAAKVTGALEAHAARLGAGVVEVPPAMPEEVARAPRRGWKEFLRW